VQPDRSKWRERFERFLSGRRPSDPLYLSNRSWQKELKLALLIVAPVAILVALIMISSVDLFHFHRSDPYEHPLAETPPTASSSKATPDPKLASRDLEVVNIRITRDVNPPVVTGLVRNNTDRKVASAAITYNLADDHGSLMGSETIRVQNLAPHSSISFQAPLKLVDAQFVIVRDVHLN
jgi:hypothetical protein